MEISIFFFILGVYFLGIQVIIGECSKNHSGN